MRLRIVVGLLVVASLGACGSPGVAHSGVAAPSPARTSAPVSSPTAIAPSTDGYALRQAAAGPTGAAMLNEALMRKARFAISQKRRFSTGGGWFWQCGTYPDPDLLTLGGTTEQWSLKTGETIGETAIEFVAPGATEAVNGMKRRYDACRTFTSDGFTYRNITALPLPKAAGFDDQVSWCQDASGFSLCLGVYRRGNLVLQLFGQGATKNSSRLLLMIGTLAAQRALHLATPPVDNLLAPSTIALIHRA